VLPGNTMAKPLRGFLEGIQGQYSKAWRIWLMDRGVSTEEVLAEMRAADPADVISASQRRQKRLWSRPIMEPLVIKPNFGIRRYASRLRTHTKGSSHDVGYYKTQSLENMHLPRVANCQSTSGSRRQFRAEAAANGLLAPA
jgi:hypothetical protein